MTTAWNWQATIRGIQAFRMVQPLGTVVGCDGSIQAQLSAAVGDLCQITTRDQQPVLAEVIGFRDARCHLLPFHRATGVAAGCPVRVLPQLARFPCGTGLLGRVIDGLGSPIDGLGPLRNVRWRPLQAVVPPPLERTAIRQPFITGQRAIDGFLTLGAGQRVGLFSGSGVGKSTLLGEIARYSSSDCNVVTLIGERGREVRPFLDDVLGPLGRQRSVVVLATSDQSPLLRLRAAQVAMSIAHGFRAGGRHVMFLCDSITRLAMAQREIGILLNEPPTARGYPPSVFRVLTQLLEQLGTDDRGSITGILSVLVEGDDTEEPVADAVRSVVDGHIVLDRELAERGHYPAIRVSRSVSRLFDQVLSPEHRLAAQRLRDAMATYYEFADMIRMGIYQSGQSPIVDNAIALQPDIEAFLCQRPGERSMWADTEQRLQQLAARWKAPTV